MNKHKAPANVMPVLTALREAGGMPYLVGGTVRDMVLGIEAHDIDVETFCLDADKLVEVLSRFGNVEEVGKSFGVFKLRIEDGTEFDFALPRTEELVGVGHNDFVVTTDFTMQPRQASERRNFTMNALMLDPFTNEVLDFHGGLVDLHDKTLRAVGPKFSEDPLRVLIGMQQCARYGLVSSGETVEVCRSLAPLMDSISTERVWGEWEKLLLKGTTPSMGLCFLRDVEWLPLFLLSLEETPQEPRWHPEGNVLRHTLQVMDWMANLCHERGIVGDERIVLMLAAMCHDLGKAVSGVTHKDEEGRIVSPGHAKEGVVPTKLLLEYIGVPQKFHEAVCNLVEEHMAHSGVQKVTARVVRRLANRLHPATIGQWEMLVESDASGRFPAPTGRPGQPFLALAQEVKVDDGKESPIIGGKMLIARGFKPSPRFKDILNECFEQQLDGAFTADDAETFLDRFIFEHNLVP
jgi:tRNA nucleotidyltransferase (CCA-adding enzyme)